MSIIKEELPNAINYNVEAFRRSTELIEKRTDLERDLASAIREYGNNSREAARIQGQLNEVIKEQANQDEVAIETGKELDKQNSLISEILAVAYRSAKPIIKILGAMFIQLAAVVAIIFVLIDAIAAVIDFVTFNIFDLSSFQTGGFTGTGRNNEVAGIVHRNEYVLPASTTRAFLSGEPVTLRNNEAAPPSTAPVNIVNVIDPSLVDEYLQSSSGQRQIINVIRANNPAVRAALA